MEEGLNNKLTLIYILNEIAGVDGEKSPIELKFINEISKRLNLSIEKVIEFKSKENVKLTIPKSENDRIFFFFHVLQIIEIDKKITKSEIDIVKKVGFKLGLNPLMVNDLIDLYLSHLGESIPSEKIPMILKKYIN